MGWITSGLALPRLLAILPGLHAPHTGFWSYREGFLETLLGALQEGMECCRSTYVLGGLQEENERSRRHIVIWLGAATEGNGAF